MKKRAALFTKQAESDIIGIYEYIAFTLLSPDTALIQVRRIRHSIENLSNMPKRYPIYDKKPWIDRELRRMNVDNFVVFYVYDDDERQVTIIRVLYSRRNIDDILP